MNQVLIVIIAAVLGPSVLAYLTGRQRRAEKILDWERQDAVAETAAKQQKAVADQAAEAAKLLLAENKKVAATAAETNGKLDIIHTLVNSNMTAAMQAELDATIRELAMMKEVIALNEAAGRQPSPEALGAVQATQGKIDELDANLSDRLKQTEVAQQQQQQQQQQQTP